MPYQELLDEIVSKSEIIFQEDLTGIYLHGSLAMGCFNPKKSDIDFILVIRNNITDMQKLQFMEHIAAWNKKAPSKGIEGRILQGFSLSHAI